MKNISVSDLKLIPELSHLREMDFIDPANADLIAPFLVMLGMDLDYPVEFIPRQHRNMQGKVVVGFMLSGEIECNEGFLKSNFATTEDRIIAAGYRDIGLAQMMAAGQTAGRSCEGQATEAFSPDMIEPHEKEIEAQIKQLQELLVVARGNLHYNDGSLKLFTEAHLSEPSFKRNKKGCKKQK